MLKKIFALVCCAAFAAAAFAAVQTTPSSMVVATQPLATRIGQNILAEGGNAIDAAVAMGYALAVVEPCCGNIGGGGFMLIHFADGKNTFIDFREKAPLAIRQSLFEENNTLSVKKIQSGYLSVGVPGTVMGLNYALKNFGTMPLNQIISPAIRLAEQGFTLNQQDTFLLHKYTAAFSGQKNIATIFLHHDKPWKTGEVLKQPQLARTLKAIAATDGNAFYHGWIAQSIVNTAARHGGVLSLGDFENYSVVQRNPVMCNYQGYHIITAPPPSAGGITLCEMLNVLSAYPLKQSGFHSAASIHVMVEAMRYAFADRNQYLGDPDFVKNPTERLLSQAHAMAIQKQIRPDTAGNSRDIGFVSSFTDEKPETTSYAVVDRDGNAVEVTYTINGYFGAGVIADDTGFFLNNEMDDFSLQPNMPNSFGLVQSNVNAIAPGKRPLSSMTPTIVTKNNTLFLVTGAAGGSTIPTQVLATLINIIDYGMNARQAIDAPRFHMQWLPDVIFVEPDTLSPTLKTALINMGYKIQPGSPWQTVYWGRSVIILNKDGILTAAVDRRATENLLFRF